MNLLDDSIRIKNKSSNHRHYVTVSKPPITSEEKLEAIQLQIKSKLQPLKLPSNLINGISIHMVRPVTQTEAVIK